MKNKIIIIIRNTVLKFLVYFAIVFSVFALIDIFVGFVIGSGVGGFFNWLILLGCSFILSIVLFFLFKINQISFLMQILLAYTIILIGVYLQGYVIRLFSLYDIRFFIICLVISILGLFLLSLILLLKNKRENDDLNKYLNQFKEREKK